MAPKYPHMLPADVEIWDRYLIDHITDYVRYDYDVHVGGSVEGLESWGAETIAMAHALAAKRIDVVGYRPGEICIFEVKPEAGVTAVGQLVMYEQLYQEDFHPEELVTCCLVCENVTPDERRVIERLGFKVLVV
jgi:hypothetical protein